MSAGVDRLDVRPHRSGRAVRSPTGWSVPTTTP